MSALTVSRIPLRKVSAESGAKQRRPILPGGVVPIPATRGDAEAFSFGSSVASRAYLGVVSVRRVRKASSGRTLAVSADTVEASTTSEADVPLNSDVGVDYTTLRDLLAAGEWEQADNEHRRLMCVLAGEEAELREWVYFTEVQKFPIIDLQTIDNLWVHYSKGRYGFSVQRKIWVGKKKQWGPFFKAIDWTTGENAAYRKFPGEFLWKADAAQGHMPLTNALRGTQLLEKLLEHPAFAGTAESQKEDGEKGGLKGLKKPSWMS